MATRTAKRLGTKTPNNKKDPKNIWFKDKKKVGRNPDRIPTRIKRMAKSEPGFRFIHILDKNNLPHPKNCFCQSCDPTGYLYSESLKS